MKDRYETIQEGVKYLEGKPEPLARQLIQLMNEMSGSDRREILNRVRNLYVHCLKFDYQIEKMKYEWQNSAQEAVNQLETLFDESPSLKKLTRTPEFSAKLDKQYLKARELASTETGLPVKTFPVINPYTLDALMKKKHPVFKWVKATVPKKKKGKE